MRDLYDEVQFFKTEKATQLAFVKRGEGEEILLFLHGMGSNLMAWSKNISSFKNRFTCVAIDIPNFGKSRTKHKQDTIDQMTEELIEFVQYLEQPIKAIIGHSMGGQIALNIIYRNSGLAEKLILVAPAGIEVYTPDEINMIERMYTPALLKTFSKKTIKDNLSLNFYNMPEDVEFMLQDKFETFDNKEAYAVFSDAMATCVVSIIKHPTRQRLSKIKTPTLVFFGYDDNLIPHHLVHPKQQTLHIAELAKEAIPNSELIMYKQCGHFLQWEKANLFNEAVLKFLS